MDINRRVEEENNRANDARMATFKWGHFPKNEKRLIGISDNIFNAVKNEEGEPDE